VLIVQAVHGQLISVEDHRRLVDTILPGGADVTYHRDLLSEHLLLHPLSAPMTLRWLAGPFSPVARSPITLRTKWPTLLNPSTTWAYCGWV